MSAGGLVSPCSTCDNPSGTSVGTISSGISLQRLGGGVRRVLRCGAVHKQCDEKCCVGMSYVRGGPRPQVAQPTGSMYRSLLPFLTVKKILVWARRLQHPLLWANYMVTISHEVNVCTCLHLSSVIAIPGSTSRLVFPTDSFFLRF